MMIWPLPGVPGSQLLRSLREVQVGASNIYSHGSDNHSVVEGYLRWISDAVQRLRLLVPPADLRRLIRTDTYWTVLTMGNPAAAPPLMRAIHDEIAARQEDTKKAVEIVESFLHLWTEQEPADLLVPDTNVLLHHELELERIPWHEIINSTGRATNVVRIVLPLVVIDELDDQKREKTRNRARRALSTIYSQFYSSTGAVATLVPGSGACGDVQLQLLLDPPGHIRLPRADDELIDRVVALQSLLEHQVNFVTYDTGAAIRATAAGLHTHRLSYRDEQ